MTQLSCIITCHVGFGCKGKSTDQYSMIYAHGLQKEKTPAQSWSKSPNQYKKKKRCWKESTQMGSNGWSVSLRHDTRIWVNFRSFNIETENKTDQTEGHEEGDNVKFPNSER